MPAYPQNPSLAQGLLFIFKSKYVTISSASTHRSELLQTMHRTHSKLNKMFEKVIFLCGIQKLFSVFKELKSCIFVSWVHISLNMYHLRRVGVGKWKVGKKKLPASEGFPTIPLPSSFRKAKLNFIAQQKFLRHHLSLQQGQRDNDLFQDGFSPGKCYRTTTTAQFEQN